MDVINTASISKRLAAADAGVARSTYYRWRERTRLSSSLQEQPSKPKYVKLTDRDCLKEAVFKLLHSPPSDHGFNRTTWKVDELQQAVKKMGLTLGKHAISEIIKKAGYRWLKAKKVLTSRDPDYRAKLDNIQRILGDLATNEGFFFYRRIRSVRSETSSGASACCAGRSCNCPPMAEIQGRSNHDGRS